MRRVWPHSCCQPPFRMCIVYTTTQSVHWTNLIDNRTNTCRSVPIRIPFWPPHPQLSQIRHFVTKRTCMGGGGSKWICVLYCTHKIVLYALFPSALLNSFQYCRGRKNIIFKMCGVEGIVYSIISRKIQIHEKLPKNFLKIFKPKRWGTQLNHVSGPYIRRNS